MLFYKSLVSFVAAIALAGSVTASTTPVRRTGGCSTGSLTCCYSTMSFSSLTVVEQLLLAVLDPLLVNTLPIGVNCDLAGTLGCDNQPLCCNTVQSNVGSLVNVAGNCIAA